MDCGKLDISRQLLDYRKIWNIEETYLDRVCEDDANILIERRGVTGYFEAEGDPGGRVKRRIFISV